MFDTLPRVVVFDISFHACSVYFPLFVNTAIAYSPGRRYTGLLKVNPVGIKFATLVPIAEEVTPLGIFVVVENGKETEGEGYPFIVGRICTVTGKTVSMLAKNKSILRTNIPAGYVFLSTTNV